MDKTGLITELLESWGEVNLFTRPRRFGKSLNMSMLRYFFGYGCNSALFEGLEISREKGYCDAYMGRFPVISITLKDISASDYSTTRGMLCSAIGNEAKRFSFFLPDDSLQDADRKLYRALLNIGQDGSGNKDIPAPASNKGPTRQDIVEIHLGKPSAVPASGMLSDAFTGTSPISSQPPVLELAMAGAVLRIPQGTDPAFLEQVLFILKGLPC